MLTLIKKTGTRTTPSGSKRKMGLFLCECGKKKEICIYNVLSGKTSSCGCKNIKQISALGKTRGAWKKKHGMFGTRFYSIYYGMVSRCNKLSKSNSRYYSDKNIAVEWKTFMDFYKDMYSSYNEHRKVFGEKNTTIDRIDSSKNYYKENCRWATTREQAKEKRRMFLYKNSMVSLGDLSEKYNLKKPTITARLKRGWSLDEALKKSVGW